MPCTDIASNAGKVSPAIFNAWCGCRPCGTLVQIAWFPSTHVLGMAESDQSPFRDGTENLFVSSNLPPVGLFELNKFFAAMLVVPTLPDCGIVRDVRIRDFVQCQETPITHLRRGIRVLG
jgi:hypothetical protein